MFCALYQIDILQNKFQLKYDEHIFVMNLTLKIIVENKGNPVKSLNEKLLNCQLWFGLFVYCQLEKYMRLLNFYRIRANKIRANKENLD